MDLAVFSLLATLNPLQSAHQGTPI